MIREDLTNQQFGEWTALEYAGNRKWLCRCSCGNIQEVATTTLKSGRSKHCMDKSKHLSSGNKQFIDITGQRFGQLTVISYEGNLRFLCQCTCGNTVLRLRKNLNSNSKCDLCKDKSKTTKIEPKYAAKKNNTKVNMIGYTCNDVTVVEQVGDDRYLCKCICGYTKEIRGYNLRHPASVNSYVCNHKVKIGQRFGKLIIVDRKYGGICVCKCDCGNFKEVFIGNLLNNTTTTCGCSKVPLYNKEEVVSSIENYINTTGYKPFIYDLMEILNIGMTAAYEYIHRYNLKHLLNSKFGSKAEQEIYKIVSKNNNVILHDRKIINPYELDIYIPEKKLAIEFNGDYWHSSDRKDKYYHQQKTIACAKKGIRLIHIFEHEWLNVNTREKIINIIKLALGNDTDKLYARNLRVCDLDKDKASEFCNRYHLQGSSASDIQIGLLDDNDNIISIMTFGKPRFNNEYEYELIRYCNKPGISIVGGAEKIFNYFINKYNPKSIITYTDITKFTGNVYTRLGFKPIQPKPITEPNYVWVNEGLDEVLTRYQTQKHKLIENGLGDISQTEDEIMSNLHYIKIYNSGNLKLAYIRKEKH